MVSQLSRLLIRLPEVARVRKTVNSRQCVTLGTKQLCSVKRSDLISNEDDLEPKRPSLFDVLKRFDALNDDS